MGVGYIVPEASHPIGTSKSGFPNDARSGRVPMAKHLVTSQLLGCNNYLCDFVSQNGLHNLHGVLRFES